MQGKWQVLKTATNSLKKSPKVAVAIYIYIYIYEMWHWTNDEIGVAVQTYT